VLAACALLSPTLCLAATVQRYDWYTSDRVTGALEVKLADDGSRRVRFHYTDRGR
jgi:hypothetical protein